VASIEPDLRLLVRQVEEARRTIKRLTRMVESLRAGQQPAEGVVTRVDGEGGERSERSMDFKAITSQVEENTLVDASVAQLARNIAACIRENIDEPEDLGELADELETAAPSLGAAVVANTSSASSPGTKDETEDAPGE
jgi:hypothetical protein